MHKTGKPTEIRCPAGYSCSTSAITINPAGYRSSWTTNSEPSATWTNTEHDYVYERDLGGFDCPTDSFQTSDRIYCQLTAFGMTRYNDASESDCSGQSYIAWIGSDCEEYQQPGGPNFNTNSDEMFITQQIHCPSGWNAQLDTDWSCIDSSSATPDSANQYVRGIAETCRNGWLTVTEFNTQNEVTHFMAM